MANSVFNRFDEIYKDLTHEFSRLHLEDWQKEHFKSQVIYPLAVWAAKAEIDKVGTYKYPAFPTFFKNYYWALFGFYVLTEDPEKVRVMLNKHIKDTWCKVVVLFGTYWYQVRLAEFQGYKDTISITGIPQLHSLIGNMNYDLKIYNLFS